MTTSAARFQSLEPAALSSTVDRLRRRIAARFPERNLGRVADEVAAVLADVAETAPSLERRSRRWRWALGVAVVVIAALGAIAIALSVRDAIDAASGRPAFEWLPVIESAINDVAFAAIACFFLLRVPERSQRRTWLALLARLRSLGHVIDMHQLTKDPDDVLSDAAPTDASPVRDLGVAELGRYLDYCSELLAHVSKAAALCSQYSDDSVVLDTVSEIETLTAGLRRGIWQKITLLH